MSLTAETINCELDKAVTYFSNAINKPLSVITNLNLSVMEKELLDLKTRRDLLKQLKSANSSRITVDKTAVSAVTAPGFDTKQMHTQSQIGKQTLTMSYEEYKLRVHTFQSSTVGGKRWICSCQCFSIIIRYTSSSYIYNIFSGSPSQASCRPCCVR